MDRDALLRRAMTPRHPWDVVVIGGGATGVGVAIDAAARGYVVLLLERHDFGKGTSSRGTKLVHGGVRYLQQGNVFLVRAALRERGLLRRNAPHLVRDLAFVVPCYAWWESSYYGLGLHLYHFLSGRYRLGRTRRLHREETLKLLPTVRAEGLRGGVTYYDSQFDDARLLINLVATAAAQGATLLNYVSVTGLKRDAAGKVTGVEASDAETGRRFTANARVVINAGGPFGDAVRRLADPQAPALLAPSQGIHLVFDRSFLPGDSALMVPRTSDGRVLFAIPWQGHTLVGTTDVAIDDVPIEPRPMAEEIEFVLATAGRYLRQPPTRADVLSVFAGVRPLVRGSGGKRTRALARDHVIHVDPSGLLTITGGKWTTYRAMAEDTVNQAARLAGLPARPCVTSDLPVHGFHERPNEFGALSRYGADAPALRELGEREPTLANVLHPALPYVEAEVVWATRHEMARTVEDVLARRTRALFLNARAAMAMAPRVAALMAREIQRCPDWQRDQVANFQRLAENYLVN